MKTIGKNAGANTIFNRIKKAKKQANSFIVDVTESNLSNDAIDSQIEKIFQDDETKFVEEIAIIQREKIIKVAKRE